MAFSERNRNKGKEAAAKVLPPGTQIREYVVGRAHARLTAATVVVTLVFVAAFIVALMAGIIIVPGVLVVLFIYYSVRPPRAVVVTDQGIALMARNWFNGRASKVVEMLPLAPVYAASPSGSATLALGSERITLPRKEFDRLAAATAGVEGINPATPFG